jgi:serine/threonine-protein kinase PknG
MDDTTSAIYGTPGFQAPEIADTGPTVPSDLYTVGRTLAALCIHTRGFHSTFSRTLPPPEDIPLFQECDSLYRFLIRATAADPDDRFQAADEMAVQLGGVLREIVATESGSPWPEVSSLFTGELRSGANEPADWRTLPTPLVATDDPAAGFLAALAAGVTPPDEVVELLAQAPERTVEVRLRKVRALVEAERYADADTVINEIALEDPWEWRAAWCSGIAALAQHDHDRALAEFRSVYATLPGELAPKVAMAQVAECDGDLQTAAHWYDIVSATDPGFTGAVFGLARCRILAGDFEGAVAAFDRIPATSSSYVDAQVAKAESMLDGKGTPLTVDEIVAVGDVITPLPLPREQQARLTARILSAALELVDGATPTDPTAGPKVLGYQLTETDVRLGLESTYRKLALQSPAGAERIALVDQANQLRPRTVW